MKHYGLYDKYTTSFILVGMGGMYLLTLGLCVFFVKQFIFDAIAATGAPDLSVIALLAMLIFPPFVLIPALSRKSHAISRYLLRCCFRKDGIQCFGLLWKPFFIPWDGIRTYGMQGYSFSYASMVFLFFSTEKEYFKKENIAKLTRSRIIFQLRDDIIPPLMEYIPSDMKYRLTESIKESKDIYIQRNPESRQ